MGITALLQTKNKGMTMDTNKEEMKVVTVGRMIEMLSACPDKDMILTIYVGNASDEKSTFIMKDHPTPDGWPVGGWCEPGSDKVSEVCIIPLYTRLTDHTKKEIEVVPAKEKSKIILP